MNTQDLFNIPKEIYSSKVFNQSVKFLRNSGKKIIEISKISPRIYLVDSENIGNVWCELIDSLDFYDKLIIFYTKNSKHMTCESALKFLHNRHKQIKWIECITGTNALDFQLVTELGAMIARDWHSQYIIFSKDNGYNAVVSYWSNRKRKIMRINDIAELPDRKLDVLYSNTKSYSDLSKESKKFVSEICKVIPTDNKDFLHTAIVSIKKDEGKIIYRAIRDDDELLDKLKKLYIADAKIREKKYFDILFAGSDDIPKIYASYCNYYENQKQVLYQKLLAEFGNVKGAKYYSVLKNNYRILKIISTQSNNTCNPA